MNFIPFLRYLFTADVCSLYSYKVLVFFSCHHDLGFLFALNGLMSTEVTKSIYDVMSCAELQYTTERDYWNGTRSLFNYDKTAL